jgi:hypothetical protein
MQRHPKGLFLLLLTLTMASSLLPQPALSQSKGSAAIDALKPLTTDELTSRSDVIVVGKVTERKSEWNNNKSRIYTRVTLAVDQCLKGDAAQKTITITTLGGEVDGVGELYTHTPSFKPDEKVVVFAQKDKQGSLRVAGGLQGKYSIKENEVTGKPAVAGDKPLEEFLSRVKVAIESQSVK